MSYGTPFAMAGCGLLVLTMAGTALAQEPGAKSALQQERELMQAATERRGAWKRWEPTTIPLVYRHDGYSIYFLKPPLTPENLYARYIDPLANSHVSTLVWGLGPGSVFCFETEAGQIVGNGLTDEQLAKLRTGDRWVQQNVRNLIEQGGPLRLAVNRAREKGLKLFARLEMQHEYGPADPDNWLWIGLVGDFNKNNPQFRIPGRVLLDYKHPEVRQHKLAVLREAAELGCDGLALDFAVYPPYFEKPDAAVMTDFVREIRQMTEAVGRAQGRSVEIMARVPFVDGPALGLDWRTWMTEGLVDTIVPTHRSWRDHFNIDIQEFVRVGKSTGVPVVPTIWQALGFVTTDQDPNSEKAGKRKYDKPKTPGMYAAQALVLHRMGADGLQFGMSQDQWNRRPWMNDLADGRKLRFIDKHYMVDPVQLRKTPLGPGAKPPSKREAALCTLPLGDDVAEAKQEGYDVTTELNIFCRPLESGETLRVFVNGKGPIALDGDAPEEAARRGEEVIDVRRRNPRTFVFDREWWRRGEHPMPVDETWWLLADNVIRIEYADTQERARKPLNLVWIDLTLDYTR